MTAIDADPFFQLGHFPISPTWWAKGWLQSLAQYQQGTGTKQSQAFMVTYTWRESDQGMNSYECYFIDCYVLVAFGN